MGDSDDEYDRKRRDKFRGERSAGSDAYRTERRDDRRPGIGGSSAAREDWAERNPFRASGAGRPRTEYREYRAPRERFSSPGRDLPPAKRMRPEWADDIRGAVPRYGYDPYLMHAWNEHYAHSLHSAYSHTGSGGGGGGNHGSHPRESTASSDLQTQPPMMTLKQFLDTQDDGISDAEVLRKYSEYKIEFKRQQLNEFFVAHKDEEWFKNKYHPDDSVKRKEEQLGFLKRRVEVFNEMLQNGNVKAVTVDTSQSDPLLRLLDTVVIKLEGGTDDDLKILDEKPKEPMQFPERTFPRRNHDHDDDVIITSVEKKREIVPQEPEAIPRVVSPPPMRRLMTSDDEENWDDGEHESPVKAKEEATKRDPDEDDSMHESREKKSKRKRTDSDSSSSSSNDSDSSSSSSSDEEDDEENHEKYDVEDVKLDEKSNVENDEAVEAEEETVAEAEAKAEKVQVEAEVEADAEADADAEAEPEAQAEKEQNKEEEKGDVEMEPDNAKSDSNGENEKVEKSPEPRNDEPAASPIDEISQDAADAKNEKEIPDSVSTASADVGGNEEEHHDDDDDNANANAKKIIKVEKNGGTETPDDKDGEEEPDDDQTETIDLDKVKDGPQPRALHRTSSIFLRNLAPSITKAEIEAICKNYDGYLRVAIADPLVERRWYRRGWVTFKRDVNIKEICWSLNNTRLRECEMGAIVNRDLSRRVRPVNGMTAHKSIVRSDIKLCAKITLNMDDKFKLWDNESGGKGSEGTATNGDSMKSYGFHSNNPVLQNITDFLIEEASAEEEELLGLTKETKDSDGEAIERDPQLISVLDSLILYLRIVHSVDFYNHCEYPYEDEMPNRCGIIHARGPVPNRISQNDIQDYIKNFEAKMQQFLTKTINIDDEELKNLGSKDTNAEVEKFVQANSQELAKDKWLCPLSGKKFKGPEFIRKHIFNKHAEKVDEVKKEVEFFNNYLRDPKRPQLPEHPGSTKRTNSESSTGGNAGFRPPAYPPPYPPPYAYAPPMMMPARGGRNFGGGRRELPMEHQRRLIGYHDLDAPANFDMFD